MRLYAFLLVAGAALCTRAASIPVAETEQKLIDIVPDNLDKLPENTSSEQELIDQANTIKDIDNQLRAKPENIPVEVIVENAQLASLTGEVQDEEINRPVPDLRNPGPPQRQEHETQNPEYFASEQQTVALFKQSVNDAQNVLRQGFQGITDGIQNIIETNAPIQSLQQNIQALRDSFTGQMNKVNRTIQGYLNTESAAVDNPVVEQTKAGFHQIEQGLFKLRNDFNREVNTLSGGVEVVAALKADSETPNESSISAPTSPAPSPPLTFPNLVFQVIQNMNTTFQESMKNWSAQIDKLTSGQSWNPFNPASSATPSQVQSDSQVTSTPSSIFQSFQSSVASFLNPAQNQSQPSQGWFNFPILNGLIFQPNKPENQTPQGTQPAPSGQPAQTPSKPEEAAIKPDITPDQPAKPTAGAETPAQAAAVTPAGPIRQILQNNPFAQGIAGAVQRLQNINNPEKPRDEQTAEQVKKLDEAKADPESKKGGGPNTGDNNDSSDSRVEQPEEGKEEIEKLPEVLKLPEVQKIPEVQKTSEDEIKEHKTEEVVDKTE